MTAEKMKAVFWEGKPFHVSVKDTPIPTIKTPDDAIIRLTNVAICGSDLHLFHGVLGSSTPPWAMGHEGIGVVTQVGDSISTIKVGDWVIVPALLPSGHLNLSPPNISQDVIFGFGPQFGTASGLQGMQDFRMVAPLLNRK